MKRKLPNVRGQRVHFQESESIPRPFIPSVHEVVKQIGDRAVFSSE